MYYFTTHDITFPVRLVYMNVWDWGYGRIDLVPWNLLESFGGWWFRKEIKFSWVSRVSGVSSKTGNELGFMRLCNKDLKDWAHCVTTARQTFSWWHRRLVYGEQDGLEMFKKHEKDINWCMKIHGMRLCLRGLSLFLRERQLSLINFHPPNRFQGL